MITISTAKFWSMLHKRMPYYYEVIYSSADISSMSSDGLAAPKGGFTNVNDCNQ